MRTKIKRVFLIHPRSVNEDYLGQAMITYRFSKLLFRAALTEFLYAIISCLSQYFLTIAAPHLPWRSN